ncbi:hypothetical protein K488DRAFT_81613 [Vararia minispora EC-137]|uniref:Uncharacterized protein n=1 Tax=Vararia minispora EC-137 TaxID=1314806 RepID=A0ACB8QYE5_9AGAM|nr:hypothetical protein K488DRAFT_81613 [Vararia minispora EC-137]
MSMTVSHVCARWRNLAFSSGELWQYIPVHLGERWTTLALQRSDPFPISFSLPRKLEPRGNLETFWSSVCRAILLALRQMHRARHIDFPIDTIMAHETVDSALIEDYENILETAAAPLLHTLILSRSDHLHWRPARLLAGGALPELRHVEIFGFRQVPELGDGSALPNLIGLSCSGFPHITTLPSPPPLTSLEFGDAILSSARYQDVIDMLSALPTLETLKIRHFPSRLPSYLENQAMPKDTRVVELPKLRCLDFKASLTGRDPWLWCPVVDNLAFPAQTNVRLGGEVGIVQSTINQFLSSSFLAADAGRMQYSSVRISASVRRSASGLEGKIIQFSFTAGAEQAREQSAIIGSFELALTEHYPNPRFFVEATFFVLDHPTFRNRISSVQFDPSCFDFRYFRTGAIVYPFHGTRTLSLGGTSTDEFLTCLIRLPGRDFFCHLDNIMLVEVTVRLACDASTGGSEEHSTEERTFTLLQMALCTRRTDETPIRRLAFARSVVDDKAIEALRELVDVLECVESTAVV